VNARRQALIATRATVQGGSTDKVNPSTIRQPNAKIRPNRYQVKTFGKNTFHVRYDPNHRARKRPVAGDLDSRPGKLHWVRATQAIGVLRV
jgi:hypothetical protein